MSIFKVLDAYSLLRRELGLAGAAELKSNDLGPKQLMILYRLSLSGATMGELAEHTMSDKASTSRTVASMGAAGWISQKEKEGDRRVTLVELTSKGRLKAEKAIEIRKTLAKSLNNSLTSQERKQFAALLTKAALGLRESRHNDINKGS
ncbi:MAG: MarR family winged helix-turn-helix transcriptional regulator [Pseudobdellovibrionaceae bacterium]